MALSSKIFVAGHRGMARQALVRRLEGAITGDSKIQTAPRCELDLTNQQATEEYLNAERPDVVLVATAKVGGIHADRTYPAEFIYENLMIASNLVHASFRSGVRQLLFLGSSCIYPKSAPQPMPESCLLTSSLEQTNEAYPIAKIAGLKHCQYYREQCGVMFHSVIPTNLYGPGDNYHPENNHFIPGMIRRFHEAKIGGAASVTIWGSGKARREFLYVDDLAAACVHLLEMEEPPNWINVGTGIDLSILELATLIAEVVGFDGDISLDSNKPDGTPRKLLDTAEIRNLGWEPEMPLRDGLVLTYKDFVESADPRSK